MEMSHQDEIQSGLIIDLKYKLLDKLDSKGKVYLGRYFFLFFIFLAIDN